MTPIKIALVDDHTLFRRALAGLVSSDKRFEVIFEAESGLDLFECLKKNAEPDVVLLDISMPHQDGFTIASKLRKEYPVVKIIAVTVDDNEGSIIKMIKLGARGYVLKDANPEELFTALYDVYHKGYYYSEYVSKTMANTINYHTQWDKETNVIDQLSKREIAFLEHICNDISNKEIAELMNMSVRTIDGYRDSLLLKVNVRTRVGLVIFAIKNNIIKI